MKKETKCLIAEFVGEAFMGTAIATVLTKFVYSKCDKVEKIMVTVGTLPVSWMLGRAWAKKWLKFCNETFDTNFDDDEIEKL